MMRPADGNGFEIAIVCALGTESNAIEAVFDEFWDEDDESQYGKAPGDPNSYTFGRIGQHHVVLAYMPGMGKGNAANVASGLRASFPNIRLGLVVGICGGVPQPTDDREEIFLGDVIVGTGVIQFDFGRQFADQVVRKDTLNDNLGRPKPEIRAFLQRLQGWRSRGKLRQRISTYIAEICAQEGFGHSTCPPPWEDKLYDANHLHKHQNPAVCTICAQCIEMNSAPCDIALTLSCAELQCDESQLVPREQRRNLRDNTNSVDASTRASVPQVHFGLFASGDLVMKSALHRDRIATQEGVLGFEMEGAGVWDVFPTIIIKGVCDYADSHKNKKWQKYSSVTAAACAKALLHEWRGTDQDSGPKSRGKSETQSNFGGGITFNNNNGTVGNQAVNQTFNGSVTFR